MQIKTLTGNLVQYNYQENRDYTTVSDRFLKNTLVALDFMVKHSLLTITYQDEDDLKKVDVIDTLLADTVNSIIIVFATKNTYTPSLNRVTFYDTHGVSFRKNHKKQWFKRNRGYNSPIALFSHELIHCYNELHETEDYHHRKQDHSSRGKKIDHDGHDLSFPNAEEVFVIKMTNQIAKRLGEDKRSNYGRGYYPTVGVLSTKKKTLFNKFSNKRR